MGGDSLGRGGEARERAVLCGAISSRLVESLFIKEKKKKKSVCVRGQ